MVVDTFSEKIAVVPMKTREWATVKPSREVAFRRLGGKPDSIYSDAEAALTSNDAVAYFRQHDIVQNATLGQAPVAKHMLGAVNRWIVHELKPGQMW